VWVLLDNGSDGDQVFVDKDNTMLLPLKEGSKPYHGQAFPAPKLHKEVLIREIERLCELGVLE
jgi:hypothetical protein